MPMKNEYFISEEKIDMKPKTVKEQNAANMSDIVSNMYESSAKDDNYYKNYDYKKFQHINICDKMVQEANSPSTIPLRHKLADFIINLGLNDQIQQITADQSYADVISKFDDIPYNAIIQVSLLHFSSEHQSQETKLFSQFKSLLGEQYKFEQIPNEEIRCINLGSSIVCYHESFTSSDICVIFCESYMKLNLNRLRLSSIDWSHNRCKNSGSNQSFSY